MNKSVKLAGLAFDAIEARVYQRLQESKANVKTGLSALTLGRVTSDGLPADKAVYAVEYRHFVSATTEDDEPFYEIAVAVKAFFSAETAWMPENGDPTIFLDEALAMAMPTSGLKLKELCTTVGISPVPTIPLAPVRTDAAETDSSISG